MKLLIFGATGFVGRHLVKRLSLQHSVTGFSRSETGATSIISAGGNPLVGALEDKAFIQQAIEDHDAVIWAAQLMLEPEYHFVADVLAWMKNSNKTFVFTSGSGVLSERTDGDWSENTFAEDDAFIPRKGIELRAETEKLVREAGTNNTLRTIVVRPPAIWGNGGTAIITEIYRSLKRAGAACYLGRGLNCYSNVHVEDLAELYALALEKAPSGALYHAVSGEINFRMLAEAVARHMNIPTRSLDYGQARDIFGPSSTAIIFAASSRTRCPRARSELQWAPDPKRLDLIAECAHPAYLKSAEQEASWVSDKERN